MKKFKLSVRSVALVVPFSFISLFFVQSCGKSSSPNAATASYNYNAPGSDWTFVIDNTANTWSGTESTTSSTVSGTLQTTSKGFLLLTVTASSGSAAPAVGSVSWAIQAPGVAIFVKPILSTEPHILTGVNAGTCPAAGSSTIYNWISGQHPSGVNSASSSSGFFGKFTLAASDTTDTVTVNTQNNLTSFASAGGSTQTFSGACTTGKITLSGSQGTMYVTASGMQLIKTGGGQAIVGVPQATFTNTDLAGTYGTILFSSTGIKPASMTINATGTSGTANILSITDAATASGSTGTITLNTANAVDTGLVSGTVGLGSGSGNLMCAFAKNVGGSTKNILSCVGQDPNLAGGAFNLMAISQ